MKLTFNRFLVLFLALISQLVLAQERNASGVVTDQKGLPLPGVNVVVKGTTRGVQTDFDGKFKIQAAQGEILVFSFMGMQTKEVSASANMNVKLTEDALQLGEVTVTTALGIKRKPDEITTSNQVVKTRELTQASNPSAIQSLAGKVSGLQVSTTSTGLNPGVSIVLRGAKSISGNNEALVVIDNIVSSASVLSSIDPNVIESINVIKGANGAALYGERGATGVIIVTTKKGTKSEKMTVDVTSSVTTESIAYLPETQNRYGQGWQGDFDWTDQGSWGPEYDGSTQVVGIPYPTATDWRFGAYEHIEDNIKPFFDTGINLQNSATIAAGNVDTGYISLNLNRQDFKGVIPSDVKTKNFFNLSGGKKVGKFMLSGIARYSNDKTSRVNGNTYQTLANTAGNIPVQMFNSGNNGDHWTLYDDSPYWKLKNDRTDIENNINEFMGEAQYSLNKNIDFVLRSSVRNTSGNTTSFTNEYIDLLQLTGTDRKIRSFYSQANSNRRVIYTDFLVNFNYDLTEKITFKSNLGLNATDDKFNSVGSSGRDLSLADYYDLDNISNVQNPSEFKSRQRTAGIFGQVDLGYNEYLFLNLTGRNDWNSALKTINRKNTSFFYPSAGIAFIPTKAFEGLKGNVLHKAKLSASYVKVGNASALAPHALNNTGIKAPGYPYFLTPLNSFILNTSKVDKDIENEFVKSAEFNVNLEFLNRRVPRITLDAAATISRNENQLLNTTVSSTTGLGDALINVGETKSRAFEVDLGFTPFKTDNIEWSGRVSYSTFKTTVVKVTDDSDIVGSGTPGIYAVEGQEFPLIRGYAYTRDDQGRVVLDSNGDPIKSSQLQILGKTTPDYILNFSTEFKYKNITLSAVADYRTGHVFYSGVAEQLNGQGRSIESAEGGRQPFIFPNSTIEGSGVTNTTQTTGGDGSYADFQSYVTDNYGYFDENFVMDASAFKLREVALNYELSKNIISRVGLSRFNVGISGRNLLTVLPKANRNYNDPETGNGIAGYSFTPPTKFYTFSINLAF
ncbi:SusC/RagA family TonB-linked outer membrane protein [Flavobacterium humi]|uniref:SusC/RagA family TonB-linked outer membrane protein n=1 Tax=Flavobacterium humi TaxID=2562683 RepID=A0A4Z0L9V8_9FLAO|nr:SusC/RagA family TonB-linked outer membrane protein [Flavobacterium humi]TGD57979.1 SusC/RagA family TonB-linked outer membrane protein [Flavobacterium humi]